MTKALRFIQLLGSILKLALAYIYVKLWGGTLLNKNIWLICEKYTEARDNGYHLYSYIRKNHPDISAYYVISKYAADEHKIQQYGNTIYSNTLKHYIYYLCALNSICSQPSGATPEPKGIIKKYKSLVRKNQHVIYLKHGIIKDELSHGIDYERTKYALFSCASKIEQEYVMKTYHYPVTVAQNIGLCRFDNLINNNIQKKKQILVMPTFRKWLASKNIPNEAYKSEKESFINSQYYCEYSKLLTNEVLLPFLRQKGYKLVFYPHFSMQPYIHCFDDLKNDVVTIADRYHYDVQQLLIESSCMITDFSSVYFDFAYMEKPEIFFQFDEEQYRSTHYKKGYFDYREDGFGPVFVTSDQVVLYLMEVINHNCEIEKKYHERIAAFFDRRDNHNCERTYNAIIQIGQKQ